MTTSDPDTAAVIGGERALLDPAVRNDRARVAALLDPEFHEFGSSGTVWDREAILDMLETDDTSAPEVVDVTATRVAPDTIHLTYGSRRHGRTTLRSSLWRRRDGAWRIFFHQGTVQPHGSRRVPLTGAEKESLHASLDRHRDAVLWKLDGLDDEQLRRPMTPSGTNLLGLVKHLAAVDYGWFCETFGRPTEPLPFDDDDEDADLRVTPAETTAAILAFYARARAAADAVIAEVGLEDVGTSWAGEGVSLRWVLIHMIEETARHAGHMDVVRELIDGATGDHQRR